MIKMGFTFTDECNIKKQTEATKLPHLATDPRNARYFCFLKAFYRLKKSI